jgi:putative transposase
MIGIAKEFEGALSRVRLASVLQIPRASLYGTAKADRDVELRDAIYAITLDWPRYGYRTVTHELRRRGWIANSKRVRRIMLAEGLQCRRRRGRGLPRQDVATRAYPNLAKTTKPQTINELWVADFTYVRLFGAFVFIAIVLDAFSRRCIGWALASHYRTSLTLEALQMALRRRRLVGHLIHHSDRGGSYTADDYLTELRKRSIEISMSRPGKPSDNAICERFMRTLKDDEIRMRDYEHLDEARKSIARYLDDTYNNLRLHSSIGYIPPAEFERIAAAFPNPSSA